MHFKECHMYQMYCFTPSLHMGVEILQCSSICTYNGNTQKVNKMWTPQWSRLHTKSTQHISRAYFCCSICIYTHACKYMYYICMQIHVLHMHANTYITYAYNMTHVYIHIHTHTCAHIRTQAKSYLPNTVCLLSRCRHDRKVIKLEEQLHNIDAAWSLLSRIYTLQLRLICVRATVSHADYPSAWNN